MQILSDAPSAALLLRDGALLALPTSGLWGIAVDPLSLAGVAHLDRLKARNSKRGYIAIAGSVAELRGWWDGAPEAEALLSRRWSAPVTVICRAGAKAPASVRSSDGTVALRVETHPAAVTLSAALGHPLISTSLNLATAQPARDLNDLSAPLRAAITAALDLPPQPKGLASTLVSIASGAPRILRAGEIDLVQIEAALEAWSLRKGDGDLMEPGPDESLDILLRGRVRLFQARKGYRSSIDAMILAFFAWKQGRVPQRCVDLGAGTGLISVLIGLGNPKVELILVERQARLVERLGRNLRLNHLQERSSVHHLDIIDPMALALPSADLVLCNPPYFTTDARIPPNDPERRDAHYESTAGVEEFAALGAKLLHPEGRFCLIYPFEMHKRLGRALCDAGLGEVSFAALKHRHPSDIPSRVLAQARAGEPSPARWLPDIFLHPEESDDSRYTPEIEDWIAAIGPGD